MSRVTLIYQVDTTLSALSTSAFSRRTVVSYWRKYVHEVLVNRLGGLSLSRKSVVRLTDRPDMTLDIYRGRKTTMQQPLFLNVAASSVDRTKNFALLRKNSSSIFKMKND